MPKIATPCFVLRMAQNDHRYCPVHTIWDGRPFLDAKKSCSCMADSSLPDSVQQTRKIRDSSPIESLGRAI